MPGESRAITKVPGGVQKGMGALGGGGLAELYLREGELAKVKTLTRQMGPVFVDVGVHAEARRALDLFRQAVEKEAITSELVRPLVAYLYRARSNPNLRFDRAA